MLCNRRQRIRLGHSMPDVPSRKLFYKIGEVCQLTDTQPYVLSFWESEFSQLAPNKSRSGQRLYRRKDVELVREIKKLLYDEGYTIAGVRQRLGMSDGQGALEELFDPPPGHKVATPPAPPPTPKMASGLEEILQLMDATDRRLNDRKK
jgi:DNA-binding transcriptional MerR regulator